MEELKFTWLINSQNPVQNVHSHMHIERLKTFLKIILVRGLMADNCRVIPGLLVVGK